MRLKLLFAGLSLVLLTMHQVLMAGFALADGAPDYFWQPDISGTRGSVCYAAVFPKPPIQAFALAEEIDPGPNAKLRITVSSAQGVIVTERPRGNGGVNASAPVMISPDGRGVAYWGSRAAHQIWYSSDYGQTFTLLPLPGGGGYSAVNFPVESPTQTAAFDTLGNFHVLYRVSGSGGPTNSRIDHLIVDPSGVAVNTPVFYTPPPRVGVFRTTGFFYSALAITERGWVAWVQPGKAYSPDGVQQFGSVPTLVVYDRNVPGYTSISFGTQPGTYDERAYAVPYQGGAGGTFIASDGENIFTLTSRPPYYDPVFGRMPDYELREFPYSPTDPNKVGGYFPNTKGAAPGDPFMDLAHPSMAFGIRTSPIMRRSISGGLEFDGNVFGIAVPWGVGGQYSHTVDVIGQHVDWFSGGLPLLGNTLVRMRLPYPNLGNYQGASFARIEDFSSQDLTTYLGIPAKLPLQVGRFAATGLSGTSALTSWCTTLTLSSTQKFNFFAVDIS